MKIEKEEFNKKIFSRINSLIDDYQLIKEDEKIAVALSGGKDSVLTLHALHDYQMNGFSLNTNLIVTFETKSQPLDLRVVEKMIKNAFASIEA